MPCKRRQCCPAAIALTKAEQEIAILRRENKKLRCQLQSELRCPVQQCRATFNRSDRLYEHIRTRPDDGHVRCAADFASLICGICNQKIKHILKHLHKYHPDDYRKMICELLHISLPSDTTIPPPPDCFGNKFITTVKGENNGSYRI